MVAHILHIFVSHLQDIISLFYMWERQGSEKWAEHNHAANNDHINFFLLDFIPLYLNSLFPLSSFQVFFFSLLKCILRISRKSSHVLYSASLEWSFATLFPIPTLTLTIWDLFYFLLTFSKIHWMLVFMSLLVDLKSHYFTCFHFTFTLVHSPWSSKRLISLFLLNSVCLNSYLDLLDLNCSSFLVKKIL